jgi:ISXO2-like transposase domain
VATRKLFPLRAATWGGAEQDQASINVRAASVAFNLRQRPIRLAFHQVAAEHLVQSLVAHVAIGGHVIGAIGSSIGCQPADRLRMGHALRLMVAREAPLTGTVEIDEFYLGGRLKRSPDAPPPGRGRKGQSRTTKAPVLAMVQRLEAAASARWQGVRALR